MANDLDPMRNYPACARLPECVLKLPTASVGLFALPLCAAATQSSASGSSCAHVPTSCQQLSSMCRMHCLICLLFYVADFPERPCLAIAANISVKQNHFDNEGGAQRGIKSSTSRLHW